MNITRRVRLALAAVLLAVAGMALMPMAAQAKEVTTTGTWGGATYTVYDDGSATVTGKFTSARPGHIPNGLRSCTTIDVSGVDTSGVTSMYDMFYNCQQLESITGLANWDTSNVVNMSMMFNCCVHLHGLEGIEGWDTSKVTNVSWMFQAIGNNSGSTVTLDLSRWDLSNVTDADDMFYCTSVLTYLDISGWDMSKLPTGTRLRLEGSYKLSAIRLGPKCRPSMLDLPDAPTEEPYTGLWVRADGKSAAISCEELVSSWTADMAGLWVWDPPSYRVSFDANGGTGSMSTVAMVTGETFGTIPTSTFERLGYEFLGWNTKADGTGHAYSPNPTFVGAIYNEAAGRLSRPGDTVTLYATWERVPTEVTTSSGEFDVTLRAGQQVTIEGLPAGSTYVVTETPVPRGWQLVRQQDTTGVITPAS